MRKAARETEAAFLFCTICQLVHVQTGSQPIVLNQPASYAFFASTLTNSSVSMM
jgi:hypothetical protein